MQNSGDGNDGGTVYTVLGYNGCGYFDRAAGAAKSVENNEEGVKANVKGMPRSQFLAYLKDLTAARGIRHRTSPICFKGTPENGTYIGGCDDFLAHVEKEHSGKAGSGDGCQLQ